MDAFICSPHDWTAGPTLVLDYATPRVLLQPYLPPYATTPLGSSYVAFCGLPAIPTHYAPRYTVLPGLHRGYRAPPGSRSTYRSLVLLPFWLVLPVPYLTLPHYAVHRLPASSYGLMPYARARGYCVYRAPPRPAHTTYRAADVVWLQHAPHPTAAVCFAMVVATVLGSTHLAVATTPRHRLPRNTISRADYCYGICVLLPPPPTCHLPLPLHPPHLPRLLGPAFARF